MSPSVVALKDFRTKKEPLHSLLGKLFDVSDFVFQFIFALFVAKSCD